MIGWTACFVCDWWTDWVTDICLIFPITFYTLLYREFAQLELKLQRVIVPEVGESNVQQIQQSTTNSVGGILDRKMDKYIYKVHEIGKSTTSLQEEEKEIVNHVQKPLVGGFSPGTLVST